MNDNNWHNWMNHGLWILFWIAIIVGLYLIFRYAMKSTNKKEKN